MKIDIKKLILSGVISISILSTSTLLTYAQNINHKVQPGDTFYLISQRYGVSLDNLMKANNASSSTILYVGQNISIPIGSQTVHTVTAGETYWTISQKYGISFWNLLKANNANEKSILYIGDKVTIPLSTQSSQERIHTVQSGDTFYIISQKYDVSLSKLMSLNGANSNTILHIGQKLRIPEVSYQTTNTSTSSGPTVTSAKPYTTYINYTVKSGDNFWTIANEHGILMYELIKANNMTQSTVLNIGDVIKVPVHHIPVKSTPGEKYGEYLEWWTEAQYVIPIGSEFEVVDFYTGKSFFAKRTTGANHADVETLTSNDTRILKEIWGGNFSWVRRPVIIKINGRKIAASASGMPHAGNDKAPGGSYTSWRSGDYAAGTNYDWIKNNDMNGIFDIHFLNSTRHKDGEIDLKHQELIKASAGLK